MRAIKTRPITKTLLALLAALSFTGCASTQEVGSDQERESMQKAQENMNRYEHRVITDPASRLQ